MKITKIRKLEKEFDIKKKKKIKDLKYSGDSEKYKILRKLEQLAEISVP